MRSNRHALSLGWRAPALQFCVPSRSCIPPTPACYSIAALLVAFGGVAWDWRRQLRAVIRKYGLVLCAFAAISVVFLVVINAVMAKPFDFRFWRSSLAIVAAYRWLEPAEMSRRR